MAMKVREILPEILNQVIILVSGSDFEQQEVSVPPSKGCIPVLTLLHCRPPVAQQQNCVANLARRFLER